MNTEKTKTKKSESLHALLLDFTQAEQAILDAGLDEQCVRDTLDGIAYPAEEKIHQLGLWIQNTEVLIDGIKKQEEALKARRIALEKRNERINNYIGYALTIIKKKALEFVEFKVMRKNAPPSVFIKELTKIPEEYMRFKPVPAPEPDKTKIAQALKNGIQIEGCELVSREIVTIR